MRFATYAACSSVQQTISHMNIWPLHDDILPSFDQQWTNAGENNLWTQEGTILVHAWQRGCTFVIKSLTLKSRAGSSQAFTVACSRCTSDFCPLNFTACSVICAAWRSIMSFFRISSFCTWRVVSERKCKAGIWNAVSVC